MCVRVLAILEEGENIAVGMMNEDRALHKGTLFLGSLAMLTECDSFIKGHGLVQTYQF